ncbi:MAG: cysteine desulfurase family protein [Thermoanaerobacterales bacterium]|nr:cysteine desulfurase family protein [Thermoanaerobacterales bacterium]
MTMGYPVYLDHAATTPVHPEVLAAMLPYFGEVFGNPASGHGFGRRARAAVEEAREKVGAFLHAAPDEIIFTSGGTEANNLAVKGSAWALRERGRHLVTTAVEHQSVLKSGRFLEEQGWRVALASVDPTGRVDVQALEALVEPDTVLISVMHANNEVGTLQPVREVAALAARRGILFHVDSVQTAGCEELDVRALGADLVSLSGHKIYGPKGIGALYVRRGTPLVPLVSGGLQESKRRAGTEDLAAIVGLGRAVEVAARDRGAVRGKLARLRSLFLRGLLDRVDGVRVNGHPREVLPGHLSLSFKGLEGRALAAELDALGVAVATGSACTTGNPRPSHVLLAMGIEPGTALGTIRISMGRGTTESEISYLLEVLPPLVERLRATAPPSGGVPAPHTAAVDRRRASAGKR